MTPTRLEHANVTVADSRATAAWLCEVFGWHIRWQGPSMNDGYTVHVGTDDSYIALYNPTHGQPKREDNYATFGTLNHIAVFTDDIDTVEKRVKNAGFTPEKLETSSTIKFGPKPEGGVKIHSSAITVQATVPGISANQFAEIANGAKVGCPVSAALAGNVEITLDAKLV